ncbi:unnamed protein product [Darwinula stevensoni]|uniref:Enoyl-[acyl-carrier-protein] reductase, mitochondrial n=1 Tax=Darwinula stevensoni TaxID=69355 RepID=A0A7R9AAH7_9CRUS|nr:unnamed protein product [Darwinula stevensoni]CAG0898436.1 unnamed protein product [Darwinula stevensoni]
MASVAQARCIIRCWRIRSFVTKPPCHGRAISRISEIRKTGVRRAFSSSTTSTCQLIYSEYGDPVKVVRKEAISLPTEPQSHEVIVEMLASPVNPADINTIQGDSIIQNGANSSVGQAVIQVAHHLGLKTINIVRDRPGIKSLKDQLYELGADHVVTEEELKSFDVKKNGLKLPLLGFNCVAGKSGSDMLHKMDHSPTLVIYGGMSRQPLLVPVSALIFKKAHILGFWMTKWNRINSDSKERLDMLEHLVDMVRKGSLVPPAHELVHIDMYQAALKNAMPSGGMSGLKQILVFNHISCHQNPRLPPGVAPQHYEHGGPPPHQSMTPPPIQGQPPPPIQGQPPPPPPPQPRGGVPGGHAHDHGHGGRPLDRDHIAQERDHIQHHMDMPVDTSKMTEQELQFHYFKMHDADNNNRLDGCELVKSLVHWHDPRNHDPNSGMPMPEPKIFSDEELANMIDPILKSDDHNRDGFIDYPEFIRAQQAAAAQART